MAAEVIQKYRSKDDKLFCVQCRCKINVQKEWDNNQLQDEEEITKIIHELQFDRTELNNLLKVTSRRSVKEVICSEIDINLARINSLRELQTKNEDKGTKWSIVTKRNKGHTFWDSQPLYKKSV